MTKFFFSITLLSLALLGCGGDAPDTSGPNNSGTVLDGYLSSATVFLDCNNNGELDAGEISTLTDDNGQYYFNVASSIVNSCVKVAKATAGITVDLDDPNSPLTQSYTMIAPASESSVVSPMTTLVYAKMKEGKSQKEAIDELKTEMSFDESVDLFEDYVKKKETDSKYTEIHNIATTLAEKLREIDTLDPDSTIADKLTSFRTKVDDDIIPILSNIKNAASPKAAKRLAGGTVGWSSFSGDYGNTRFSRLDAINTANVSQLEQKWKYETGRGAQAFLSWYFNPLVVRDTMYIPDVGEFTKDKMGVIALNAKTGAEIWKKEVTLSTVKDNVYYTRSSRGLGYGNNRIYLSTYDARVWSINAKTGELDKNFKDNSESAGGYITTADGDAGYYLTQAPVFIPKSLIPSSGVASGRNIIIIGNAGGEHQTRGHISAYDADNGELLWRFYTVPSPSEYGGDTWPNVTTGIFKNPYSRGGGAVWVPPAFDAKNGLVIFGTGNAGPDLDGTRREGANLFTDSIVAVNVATGQRVWHFQQVHHDLWDYDQGSSPMIFNLKVNGEDKTIVGAAGKTGWYYLFDSKTGELLHECPETAVSTTTSVINIDGQPEKPYPTQPMCKSEAFVSQGDRTISHSGRTLYISPIFTPPGPPGTYISKHMSPSQWNPNVPVSDVWVEPSVYGGSDFPPLSHSPLTGLSYIPANIGPTNFTAVPDTSLHDPSKGFGIGGYWSYGRNKTDTKEEWSGQLVAYDPLEGKVKWIHKTDTFNFSGTCSTAGNLVFMPETVETSDVDKTLTYFSAFNATTGERLLQWPVPDNVSVNAGCITYEIEGKQYIAFAAGGSFNNEFGSIIGVHCDDIYVLGLPD